MKHALLRKGVLQYCQALARNCIRHKIKLSWSYLMYVTLRCCLNNSYKLYIVGTLQGEYHFSWCTQQFNLSRDHPYANEDWFQMLFPSACVIRFV